MTLFVFNNGISSIISSNQKPYNFARKKPKDFSPLANLQHESSHAQTPNKNDVIDNKDLDALQNRRLLTAASIMSHPVITVMSHELVIKAKLLMKEHKLAQLIVINKNK